MYKTFLMVLLLVFCLGAMTAFEAPAELDIYGAVEIPGFAIGPMADFLYFPWSIDIGDGHYNHLGVGGSAGLFTVFSPQFGIAVPIQALFAGRFEMIENLTFDVDARLGFMLGRNTVFYGASNVFFHFDSYRVGVGVTFHPNPYYDVFDYYSNSIAFSFLLSGGYVHKIEGMEGNLLF